MRNIIPILLLACISLSGCKRLLSHFRIVDVQQGNVITRRMISRVHPGMSKMQVRSILGDPVLKQVFAANRWDYVYTMQKAKGRRYEQGYTIYFNRSGLVSRIVTIPRTVN